MGREVKRVALDFDWPLKKVWKGFVNPHFKRCTAEDCHGGETSAGAWISALAHFIAMIGEEAARAPYAEELRRRGQIYPHPYLETWARAPREREPRDLVLALEAAGEDHERRDRIYREYWSRHKPKLLPLTEGLSDFVSGLAGRRIGPGPFNGNPEVPIYYALLKAAGIKKTSRWDQCDACGGTGIDASVRAAYEAWESEEPPSGPGWQLWETVSEGSPVSPVFASREEFVEHIVQSGYTRVAAEAFTTSSWAPTATMKDGVLRDGIASCEPVHED